MYWIIRFVVSIHVFLKYRIKVYGYENVNNEGGAIVCSNHISAYDPVILGIALKRKIHFMGKKELFENKFLKVILTFMGVFPVDREKTDVKSYKTAINYLKNNEMLGIFAQGTRLKEIDAKNAKAGAMLFALKGKAPIIPVAIISTYKPFSKVVLKFGEPILLDEYFGKKVSTEKLNELTEELMGKISKLAEEPII